MRYIIKQPLRKHEVYDLPEGEKLSLEKMQGIVGGYLESVHIPELQKIGGGLLTVFANEEGKLQRMIPNIVLAAEGKIYDIVVGNIIILNYTPDGERMIDLTDEQIQAVQDYLQKTGIPM